MVAKFHEIVRSRGGSASQLERGMCEGINDRRARLAIVGLEDARLVQHHASEVGRIKVLQHFVVRDGDAWQNVSLPAGLPDGDAELPAFPNSLSRHGKRGEDQDVARNVPSPFNLHGSFTQAAVGKYGCAAPTQRPRSNVALEVEQHLIEGRNRPEPGLWIRDRFADEKFAVVHLRRPLAHPLLELRARVR